MIVTAKATGRQLGAGFYGSVEEVYMHIESPCILFDSVVLIYIG